MIRESALLLTNLTLLLANFPPAMAAPEVVRASDAGAKLDSNLMSGGGTDDTVALQLQLDRATRDRPLRLIVDGPALIRGLAIRGYTTLECSNGGGFFLKADSNVAVLRNANRSRDTAIDTNIVIRGCFLNGNRDQQLLQVRSAAGYATNPTLRSADGSFKVGLQFFGVDHLNVQDVTLYNMRTFGSHVANATFVEFRNVTIDAGYPPVPHTASKAEISAFVRKHYTNNDGLHFSGPIRYLTIDGATLRTSDDAIALNANSGLSDEVRQTNEFGPYVGQGAITDVLVRNVTFNGASHGIRLNSRTERIDRISFSDLTGSVFERFVVVSSWISKAGGGNIGTVSFDGVDVRPLKFPNWYETCRSERCKDELAALGGPPESIRWFEEDAEFPMFSINTSVDHLTLSRIVVNAADARPILRIGAHANLRYLKADITIDDPDHQATPLVMVLGARIGRFDYLLNWF